jgi:hypothetical protein
MSVVLLSLFNMELILEPGPTREISTVVISLRKGAGGLRTVNGSNRL